MTNAQNQSWPRQVPSRRRAGRRRSSSPRGWAPACGRGRRRSSIRCAGGRCSPTSSTPGTRLAISWTARANESAARARAAQGLRRGRSWSTRPRRPPCATSSPIAVTLPSRTSRGAPATPCEPPLRRFRTTPVRCSSCRATCRSSSANSSSRWSSSGASTTRRSRSRRSSPPIPASSDGWCAASSAPSSGSWRPATPRTRSSRRTRSTPACTPSTAPGFAGASRRSRPPGRTASCTWPTSSSSPATTVASW